MALKETLLTKSLTSHALDEDELIQLVNQSVTNLDDSSSLPTAGVEYLGQSYIIKGVHYVCELVETVPTWVTYDTSGQSLHYPDASGKPTIDGITINGAWTKADLGIAQDMTDRTLTTDPTNREFLLGDTEFITYEYLSAALSTLFNIPNLPKYERFWNPILGVSMGKVSWEITHTCSSGAPVVQLFDSSGKIQTLSVLPDLQIIHYSEIKVYIIWTSSTQIPANSYYVVLIG
jgi:hypothetical protein